MSYQLYPSDLTDREWEYINPLVPLAKPGERNRETDMRLTVNAIFYLTRTGCSWRYCPKSIHLGKWSMDIFVPGGSTEAGSRFTTACAPMFESKQDEPLNQQRQCSTVKPSRPLTVVEPSAAMTRARKPLGANDIFWLIRLVLAPLAHSFSKLRKIWADSIYAGALVEWVRELRTYRRIDLEIVKRTDDMKGFVVLPRRWVVERTFAWLSFHRRLSNDYEYLPATSEAFIHISMIRLMLARLA
jgi:putative transposase